MSTEKILYESFNNTISNFGLSAFDEVYSKSEYHTVEGDYFVIIGITGEHNGIITFEYDKDSFDTLSEMMIPDSSMRNDFMSYSAISEFVNMFSGNFLMNSEYAKSELTPPITVTGKKIYSILNNIETKRIYFSVDNCNMILSISIA